MPAKKCIPCLSADIKALIVDAYPALAEQLEPVLPCKDGAKIDLCQKKKSAYQEFTAQCLKEHSSGGFNPEAMRACAGIWKEKKAAIA